MSEPYLQFQGDERIGPEIVIVSKPKAVDGEWHFEIRVHMSGLLDPRLPDAISLGIAKMQRYIRVPGTGVGP